MSAFVISFVVVGVSIAIVTRIVTDELFQPATRRVGHGRGRHLRPGAAPAHVRARTATPAAELDRASIVVIGREMAASLRWWQRARSAALLTLMIIILGLATAAVIGLVTVLLITFLRNAVG